jgi:hypothetical protein
MRGAIASAVQCTANGKLTTDPRGRPVSVTMRAQGSCPPGCPLLGSGCYAESGPQGIHTARLNRPRKRSPLEYAEATAEAIDGLRAVGQPLRVDIVGDDRTPAAAAVTGRAVSRFRERGGGRAWKYSHAWRDIPRNSWGAALSILASVETVADGVVALDSGYAPARVVARFPTDPARGADGIRWIPCPAQVSEFDCERCRLCTRGDSLVQSRAGILFAAHGSGARRVRNALEG